MAHGNKGKKHIYNEELDDEKHVEKEDVPYYLKKGYRSGGRPLSEESKQKQSKVRKEKTYEEIYGEEKAKEITQKQSKVRKGKIYEELYGEERAKEIKEKIREGNIDIKRSDETKKNMSIAQTGLKRIYKNNKSKKVKIEKLQDYLDDDWVEGHSEETKQSMRKPKSEEGRKNIRLGVIKRIENRVGQIFPNYNPEGCQILNEIAKQSNTFIQHAENGGEYHIKELGYWVDGYDKENNIVYEYDEIWHYENEKLREKDTYRQKEITEHLNCKFIRIKKEEIMN